jgi:hypothetical protein
MLPTLQRTLAVTAICATGIIAGTGTAHATTVRTLTVAAAMSAASPPSSRIEGSGTALRFVPKSITGTTITGQCSTTNYSFLVVNDTKAKQQVVYMGAPLGNPIKPKQGLLVCDTATATGSLSLSRDSHATLRFAIT